MLKVSVDFARLAEDTIIIPLNIPVNAHIRETDLSEGMRIIVHDEELEFTAVVQGPIGGGWWTAKIVPGTLIRYE